MNFFRKTHAFTVEAASCRFSALQTKRQDAASTLNAAPHFSFSLSSGLCLLALCLLSAFQPFSPSAFSTPAPSSLASGFSSPPSSARPLTWWHWINGNITKEGIRADLTAMRDAGIAGVQLFDASIYMPMGPVRYGSDNWHEHVQYAIRTAAELGLDVSLMNTPGWSASGGPWITPERSMKKLVWTELNVTSDGSTPLRLSLPLPPARENFYRDIAVLAVPADPPGCDILRSPQLATATSNAPLAPALDDDPGTAAAFNAGSQALNFSFTEPVTASQLSLVLTGVDGPYNMRCAIRCSNDGKNFTELETYALGEQNAAPVQVTVPFRQTTARHFRVSISVGRDSKPIAFSLASLALSNPPRLASWHQKIKLSSASIPRAPDIPSPHAIPREKILDLATQFTASDAGPQPGPTLNSVYESASGSTLRTPNLNSIVLPAGTWTILRFGFTSTGAKNHPAAPEGHGLECDKLDAGAVAFQFDRSVGRIIREAGPLAGKTLTGLLFDSFEAGFQNWTDTLPAQFRAAHNYDLVPLLPALTGRVIDSAAFTECVLSDFRETINAGIAKNYFGTMQRLAHAHGMIVYAEAQGGPLNPAVIEPYMDVVMNEFWHHARFPARLKLCASIVNIHDKHILAAEAFSARPEEDGWSATLASLKRPGDHAFASGVNRCILHTYAHQPFSGAAPGFTLGRYGTRFNRLQTWWHAMPAWTAYIARSQFLLQQGWKHADILLLQNEDLGYAFPPSEITRLPDGYDFDICYPRDLDAMAMRDGALTLPHGPVYRVLVTPQMPWAAGVATLRRLRDFVRDGLVLCGNPPAAPAGAADLYQKTEYNKLVSELWPASRKNSVASALAKIPRDLDWSAPGVRGGMDNDALNHIHRRTTGGADIYFLFNNTAKPLDTTFTFRVTGRAPELWDAVSGARVSAPRYRIQKTTTQLPLSLPAYGSIFVIFENEGSGDTGILPVGLSGMGGSPMLNPPAIPLTGPWHIAFANTALGVPAAPVTIDRLASWSDNADDAIRHYSGSATYVKTFTLPPGAPLPSSSSANASPAAILDLGRVADIAELRVNGRDVATLWTPPYRADITAFLRPGENTLEIRVTNTWVNRLIGDERIPVSHGYQKPGVSKFTDGRLLELPGWLTGTTGAKKNPRHTFSAWKHYDADSPLLPAGLLGPVKLEWLQPLAPAQ